MRTWTIGFVNYYTTCYMEHQLKMLYEFNDPKKFQLIVVDNSSNLNEFNKLNNICNPYIKEFNNIKIIDYKPQCTTASGQHGEGVDLITKHIKTKYFLIQDPDFFWLRKEYLKWLEKLLQYNDAVGAPYDCKMLNGQEYFPSAFGCAYNFKKIIGISFSAYINNDIEYSNKKFSELNSNKKVFGYCYDVGWQIRLHLSQKNSDDNFLTFEQTSIKNKLCEFMELKTPYCHHTNTFVYTHNGKIVAAHLYRGSVIGKSEKNSKKRIDTNKMYVTRNYISKFMYKQIKSDCKDLDNILYETKNPKENTNILDQNTLMYIILYKCKKNKLLRLLLPIKRLIVHLFYRVDKK